MNSNSIQEIDQEDLTPATPALSAARKTDGRKHILLLLLLSSLVLLISAYICDQIDIPTGDEPHYLVISQTLLLYHSLDVTKDYANNDYKVFYEGPLGPFQHTSLNKWGQLLPLHSIGAPVLWLIPFAIAGRLGTLLFMALASALIILNIYLLLVSLGIRRDYAFFTSLAMALASPIWIYSHHDFVEPLAALFCVYIVQVLFKERLRAWDLLGSSLALGVLPWLHIRFALFEVVLAGFLLARVYQDNRFSKLKPYLLAILPVAAMFFFFEGYNFFVWGSLNPAVNQANSGEVPFDVSPWHGLFGLFFDQEYGLLTNFPIFLFLLGGIILALKKKFLRFNILMLLLSGPYIITIASFHNWDGAISPPARFLMVLVPLLAFYLALALQKARSWIMNGLFLLCAVVAMLYEGASLSVPGGWMNWEEGYSRPLVLIARAVHLPLTMLVPTVMPQQSHVNQNHYNQILPIALWLLLLGGLALSVLVLSRRRVVFAGNPQSSNS